MSSKSQPVEDGAATDSMRDEYDFSEGARGKYASRFRDGSNVVVLDPDVAKKFPDSRAVNEALRRAAGIGG